MDTSILIGLETRRISPEYAEGFEWAISVVSLGELRLGVLAADGPDATARRLDTLEFARRFHPLPIDEAVSDEWARLVAALRSQGGRMPINDSWIAATAMAHGVPVLAQDSEYDGVPGLGVLVV